jgi:hypothetical protein
VGVNIFILDRRRAKLDVAGVVVSVGLLRRFWKITELDEKRADELARDEHAALAQSSPHAAIVVDVMEFQQHGSTVRAHQVIGWEPGRAKVTDMGWDYLPAIGFAVRNPDTDVFVLHEEVGSELIPLTRDRALATGLMCKSLDLI